MPAPVIIPKYLEIVYNENDAVPTPNDVAATTDHAPMVLSNNKVVETQPYEIPISGILVVGNNQTNQSSSTVLPRPVAANQGSKDSLHHTINMPNHSLSSNFSSIVSSPGGDDSLQTLLPQVVGTLNAANGSSAAVGSIEV